MNEKRLLITIPKSLKQYLYEYCEQNDVNPSYAVKDFISHCSKDTPKFRDVDYKEQTERVQLTMSVTTFQLLSLWAEKTEISKSKLIAYSIQKVRDQLCEQSN